MERIARLNASQKPGRPFSRLWSTLPAALMAALLAAACSWLCPFSSYAGGYAGEHAGETARIDIGTVAIPYAVPEGLAGVKDIFPLNLKVLDEEFNMDTRVFGMYVPKAYLNERAADPDALPGYYLQLCHDAFFLSHSLGETSFFLLCGAVETVLARQYAKERFREKFGAVFSEAVGMPVRITSLSYQGLLEREPLRRTMFGSGKACVTTSRGETEFPFAVATTLHMTGGKVLCTIQIGRTPEAKALEAFRREAPATAKAVWGWQ